MSADTGEPMKEINRMNSKAELIDNVLGLIIAAIGLGLFFLAVGKFIGNFADQDLKNAKNILDSIEGKIDNLNDGEVGRFPIKGLDGWFFAGWSKDDANKPERCFLDSCLCICKGEPVRGGYAGERFDERRDVCQKEGICRKASKDNVTIIGVEAISYIKMPENIAELEINKTKFEFIIKKNE